MLFPKWVHYCKDSEIKCILRILEKQQIEKPKILEIGAGDGYMSKLLSKAGYDVTSTDPSPRMPLEFDVHNMNVNNLEFEDSSYDIVISSNVIEHIDDLEKAFSEMKRVLKNEGVMIHAVPTVYCNLATMLIQPIAYFRNILYLFSGRLKIKVDKEKSKLIQFLTFSAKVVFNVLNPLRFFISKGHGVSRNRFRALYIWRRSYWTKIFRKNNLEVVSIKKAPYLYSMHKVFPFLMDKLRYRVGKRFNSVDIYLLCVPDKSR